MVQQAPPEVGTVLDGYRFKGGDPKQESSWEPVTPPGAALLPRSRATGDRRSEEAYWGRRRTQGDPAVLQAESGVAQARRAEGLIARQEAQGQGTGGIYGVPIIGQVAGFLDPEIRELDAIQARQARLERQPGEGAISDFDAAQFVQMTYGRDKPIATNRALIAAQRAANDAVLQKREFDEWYFSQFGTTNGSQEAWRRYAQENPIFDPASQQSGDPRMNERRLNWRQYFTGEGGLDTQAVLDARNVAAQSGDLPPGELPQATAGINAVANSVFDSPEIVERDGKTFYAVGLAPGQGAPQDLQTRYGGDGEITADEMIAAGYVPDQETGKWLYPADNPVDPQGPQGGPPPAGPGGSPPPSQGYQTALEQERANADLVSRAGGGYNMTDALTGEFNDELAYGAGYLTQGLGNIGRRLTGREIEVSAQDRARASRDVMAQDRDEFARERPVQNFTGNVLGAAAFGPQGAARTMVGRMAQGAGMGATYGFAGAEGNVVERLPEAAIGAGVGAIAVPVVEKAVAPAINALARPVIQGAQSSGRFLGRQAGNVGNALGIPGSQRLVANNQPNPLASGMNRFADRMGAERVNALNPNLATARNNGLDQADLIDVLDDGSIGRMRALATRDTPGRDRMVQSAERRRANLPSRAARIASEEISQDTRPALQAISDLRDSRRANASAIDAFANDPVPIDPNLTGAMQSDLVRSTLRDAARRAQGAVDPVERQAAERLTAIAEGRASMTGLTVREAQDISRALDQSATSAFRTGSPDGPVLADLSKAIRQSARDNSQGYDSWLRQYGDDSDLIEAATTGRNFVSVSKDPASARGTEAFVQRAQQAGPAELGIQRAAAREAVEVAGSNPSGARTVLEGFANDAGQARRAAALGADAGRLQARASAELDSVTRHQRASPRIGSESSVNLQDSAGAAGAVVGTARDVMTANVPGLASRAMNAIRSRGFSNQEAEAIVTAANDPAQTDQLVAMLAERMTRREARSLARAIRYQVTTSLPTNQ